MRTAVLWGRTVAGRRMAVRWLDLLADGVGARGYRCVRLYRVGWRPMLWVYARGAVRDVGVLLDVRAVPGGLAYHETERGRAGYLSPCGEVEGAVEQVDLLLKHRMFPATW